LPHILNIQLPVLGSIIHVRKSKFSSCAARIFVITLLNIIQEGEMRTVLRKVGNSRGVLIPAAFLAEYGVGAEIEMRQDGRSIIIEPVQSLRRGWFDNYHAENEADDHEEKMVLTAVEEEDWQW
jgi:antitoxin MazE